MAWLGLVAVALSVLVSRTPVASAQAQRLTLPEMHLSIWPEYDDPRLLVLYRGRLPAGTTLPQTVEFRIPPQAEVNAAAYVAADGRLISNPPTTRVEGEWQVVSYTVNAPEFQLEFYAPLIQGEPSNRQVDYRFSTTYPVQSLQAEIQQPLRSTNFQVTPAPSNTTTDTQGFQVANYNLGSAPADATFDFKISYSKSDATPSVPRATMPASGLSVPLPAEPQRAADNGLFTTAMLALALAVAGVGLIGAALVIRNRRPALAAGAAEGRKSGPPAAVFCTHCGHQLEPDARFCPQCGTPVRRASPRKQDF